MKVRISLAAERDLRGIVRYVAQDRPRAALGLYDHIIETGHRLGDFPLLGKSFTATVRCLLVTGTPYAILYRVKKSEVLILRVRHAAQNWR